MSASGEFERIAALIRGAAVGEGVVLGPGDDAAVLRPRAGRDLVVTTDTFVEGRHFRRGTLDPVAIGRRLAAANLSDLAAMAAAPRWALFSIAAPSDWSEAEVRAVQDSARQALEAEGAAVVGGNLAGTDGPLVVSVTLLGDVEPGRHWTRAGGRVGDALAVSGVPGRAALALAGASEGDAWPAEYRSPPCRVRLAQILAAVGGVTAAIDLSDGLSGDLAQLAVASGVGAELFADALSPGALEPSDDYELLLAIEPSRVTAILEASRAAGAPLTLIGRCVEHGLHVTDAAGTRRVIEPRGYDHFA